MTAQRLTYEALELLAFAKRASIELDREQGLAFLSIGRRDFVATLPPVEAEGRAL